MCPRRACQRPTPETRNLRPENPEFPLFIVTSRFDVEAELGFEHGKFEVTVHYRLLGKYDMAEGYSEDATEIGRAHV